MSETDNKAGDKKKDETEKWPDFMQLVLMVVMLLLSGFFFIVLPMMVATKFGFSFNEVTDTKVNVEMWGTLIAVLLGLTTMTVTAIFLFMTFRIDREVKEITKAAAHDAAEDAAKKEVEKVAKEKVDDVEADAKKRVDDVEADAKKKVDNVVTNANKVVTDANEVVDNAKEEVDNANKVVDNAKKVATEIKEIAEAAKKDINEFLLNYIHDMTPEEKKEFIKALREMINSETGGFWERLRGKFSSDKGK